MADQRTIDQEARDLARQGLAEIRRHAAVCTECEKRRDDSIEEMKQSVRAIQIAHEKSDIALHARIGSALDATRKDITKAMEDSSENLRDAKEKQQKINDQLFNRFWLLIWVYAGGMTTAAAFMFVRLMHW